MPQFKRAKLTLSGNEIAIWFKSPNAFGVNIKDAVNKWIEVTEKDFTAESLVKFINSQMPGCALTEEQFSEIPLTRKRYRN